MFDHATERRRREMERARFDRNTRLIACAAIALGVISMVYECIEIGGSLLR